MDSKVSGNRKTERDTAPRGQSESPAGLLQLVGFRVGQEEFCLDILRVQEIIRLQPLTRVPNSPPGTDGVMNLRGRIIPVISLRKRFGLDPVVPDKKTRIVVVEAGGVVLGFIVDSVSEVLRIPAETLGALPRIDKVEREYIAGVGKIGDRLLMLLDVDQLTHRSLEVPVSPATGAAAGAAGA